MSALARAGQVLAGTAVMIGWLVLPAGAVLRAEIIDRVLAVAAGDVIMLSDVRAARDLGLVQAEGSLDPVRDILTKLIDRSLILAEVERYAPPEPGADAIDRELTAVRARFATLQEYERALASAGLVEPHLRETLRQDLRIRAYLEQRFAVPVPGDEELQRYFRDHRDRFTRGGVPMSFDEARALVVMAATEERRQRLMNDWVGGLRRRAEIHDLYRPAISN